jgi:Secretion system C-terminal sorting domain
MVDLDGKSELSVTIKIAFRMGLLITIKPNPASTFLIVTMDRYLPGTSVSIFDQRGSLVKQMNRNFTANQPMVIDVSGLPKGIYILTMKSGDLNKSEKLIIQ